VILIAGGTGRLGTLVVNVLVDRGLEVRVLTRDAQRAGLSNAGVEVMAGDVRDRNTLDSVVAGADIVISTYPAATSVLGYLRRRGRVQATACATITDLGAVCFWAHPGIDLHLVMHERLVVEVEREAGAGSARVTRPLVARAFFQPACQTASRNVQLAVGSS